MKRVVALKVLAFRLTRTPEARKRFQREVRTTNPPFAASRSRINFGRDRVTGWWYFEFVDGKMSVAIGDWPGIGSVSRLAAGIERLLEW